ncbi:MAG: kelch repeat-containing protein [Planctomycetota bacterium]
MSVNSAGQQANNLSLEACSISSDGRYVAFSSDATNLVDGDTNGYRDVFVHDRQTGATIRVSVNSQGDQGDGPSYDCAISGNGRFVTFGSFATNLVGDDTNSASDVFVYDRDADGNGVFDETLGVTTRESLDSSEIQGIYGSYVPAISSDGRYVAFVSADTFVSGDMNQVSDVFRRDRAEGTTTAASVASGGDFGTGQCQLCSISPNGRFVTFLSIASDLAPGDGNGVYDVFVHDFQSGGSTLEVSVDSGGLVGDGPSFSSTSVSDAGLVVFASEATNLLGPGGDNNNAKDVFLRDIFAATTTLISVSASGAQGDGLSDFDFSSMTPDGRYVAFYSTANNLVSGDTNGFVDCFVKDRSTGDVTLVSVDSQGGQGNLYSYYPSISANGRFVAFLSTAGNLVPNDTNGVKDVFVRDLLHDGNWTRMGDLTGLGRSGAVGVAIGGKAYVLTGLTTPMPPKNAPSPLWEYRPGSPDSWARKADFPGEPRYYAVGFAIGTKLYIGTGQGVSSRLKDLWEWDQTSDQWSRKADLPSSPRYGAIAFSIGGKGYVGTGWGINGQLRDLWEYTPVAGLPGSWTQKASMPGVDNNRGWATGFSVGGSGFVGLGFGVAKRNDLWEYLPGSPGTWIQRAPFPGGARYSAVGFAIDGRGYVGTGFATLGPTRDFWEYSPGNPGTWTRKTDFGGTSRTGAIGFSIDGKGYLGTGYGQRDLWRYTP